MNMQKTPLKPPLWTNNPNGIQLSTAPVCGYCDEELGLDFGGCSSADAKNEALLEDLMEMSSPSVNEVERKKGSEEERTLPKWMDGLPGNRAQASPKAQV